MGESTHQQYKKYGAPGGQRWNGNGSGHLQTCLPDTQTQSQPDPFPRGVCTNSKYRARVTPAQRGRGKKSKTPNGKSDQAPVERHTAMTWAQRSKRVFNIDKVN